MTRNPFLTAAMLMSAMFLGATIALSQDNAASRGDGQASFNNACRTCHSVKAGDNRLGPSLAGIVGQKSGSQAGFNYSSALKDGSITWDEKTLDGFIANPDAVAPGNSMKPYTGMTDAAERAKIVAFLKSGGGVTPD
ncbi:MAG: c-type cytochrome [Hyphomicrobium sp.]